MSRSRNGVNIGGGAAVVEGATLAAAGAPVPVAGAAPGAGTVATGTPARAEACLANHSSTRATKAGSRSLRFSCVTRRLRVSRVNANWSGSRSM